MALIWNLQIPHLWTVPQAIAMPPLPQGVPSPGSSNMLAIFTVTRLLLPIPTTFSTTLQVPRPSLKHVIGKGGATLAKIEDLPQCFIFVQDCGEQMAVVNFCGDSSGLGRFLVSALGHGHYSVLSTLQRNGVSLVALGLLIP